MRSSRCPNSKRPVPASAGFAGTRNHSTRSPGVRLMNDLDDTLGSAMPPAAAVLTDEDPLPPARRPRRRPAPRGRGLRGRRSRGQALLIAALLINLLILFVGLGVDVGFLMARRAKLQSAVDASALSAAQALYTGDSTLATTRANQVLTADGIPASSLAGPLTVGFPGDNQVRVAATQRVDTFFIRLIPIWQTVNISAEATADTSSYAEILTKPSGKIGVVSALNLMVWGVDSHRGNGDAYSPAHLDNGTTNPWYADQPYGYLYRIDVPASYLAQHTKLDVQIFDPDSYNRPDLPPTPCTTPGPGTPVPSCTPTADMQASCVLGGTCTSSGAALRHRLAAGRLSGQRRESARLLARRRNPPALQSVERWLQQQSHHADDVHALALQPA